MADAHIVFFIFVGVGAVSIVRLLHEAAFPPDRVQAITAAYEQTCKQLELMDREDPLMMLVAKKVIEIAQNGERDPESISRRAVKELLGFSIDRDSKAQT